MPMVEIPGVALLLGILLTIVRLGVAKLIGSIYIEDIGALIGAVIGLIVVGWAVSFVWPFILADKVDLRDGSRYAVIFGLSLGVPFVTNTLALGVTSLVVSGLKVRGFAGLLVAGFVITLVEQSLVLIQLARIKFS